MTHSSIQHNPFKVLTPEHMRADEAHSLFVEPFTEFQKLCEPGHAMLHGPRGSGKSMIFRYLLADCQCLARQVGVQDLQFLAFLVSIKNTGPTASLVEFTEARKFNPNASFVLNEHVLTIYVASKMYKALGALDIGGGPEWLEAAKSYFHTVKKLLIECGAEVRDCTLEAQSVSGMFQQITEIFDELYREVGHFAKRLAIDSVNRYTGPLCGYHEFLVPAIDALRKLPFLPDAPTYLLVDDADYLNSHQTKVLNSWISTRTIETISIKVSTQFRYKSFSTISGFRIESPHDFHEVNIAHLYTTDRGQYTKRIREVVRRRLEWWSKKNSYAVEVEPDKFFPPNEKQEAQIREIEEQLRTAFKDTGRGYRSSDDVTRYARPNYIRALGGPSKSTSNYSYAGFSQLVHVSSGLVRYFLEAAAIMFDDQIINDGDGTVKSIKDSIQDKVIRAEADNLLGRDFDTIFSVDQRAWSDATGEPASRDDVAWKMKKLRNLIHALGGVFYARLISDFTDRRVFSVSISGEASSGVKDILDLGVQFGFFHRSMIGNKSGTGRSPLYVLTRRLAPFFKLDPSSFAGYLWVTDQTLRQAMVDPESVIQWAKEQGASLDIDQLSLFS